MHIELETRTRLEELRSFLAGNAEGAVLVPARKQAYEHIARVLRRFSYWKLGKGTRACCGATWRAQPACRGPSWRG